MRFIFLSLLYTAPKFVAIYEIGDYVYLFFREEAVEADTRVS